MGYLGLGSTFALLGMKYGSPESVKLTEDVSREMAVAGWEAGLELAREKGPAPIMSEDFTVTAELLRKRPEMKKDGWKIGARIPGRLLHARYSRYMQRIASVAPQLVDDLAQVGARFTHHTSIAPTGTISLSLANNASNGIEPSFAHHYFRNVIREGRKTKEKVDVFSFELLAYRELVNHDAMPNAKEGSTKLPDYFSTADEVTPHAARGHPGRRADLGRQLHLQDRECAHRLRVRGFQAHLPIRPREGAEGLHDLPLQPRGLPGRAGEGRRPEETPSMCSRWTMAAKWKWPATKRSNTTARSTPPRISTTR